ncbi:hypothetical protein BIY23_00605 [Wolbachia pipientis]|uniref:Uncharacterized protein n=2 Tax=Wolbachia pipientis TaxID=955 RepID=A0A1E7QL30_WOLPI|nr:hypothetical protein BIY23_00605 [Wolbachia pipientis]
MNSKNNIVQSNNAIQNQDELIDLLGNNSFIKNKIINIDGLTLDEVFQALVQMLSGDLELVEKVLMYANIMVKNGMKIPKESQLTRADVRRILQGKENKITYNFTKSLPILPNVKTTTAKKSRGA